MLLVLAEVVVEEVEGGCRLTWRGCVPQTQRRVDLNFFFFSCHRQRRPSSSITLIRSLRALLTALSDVKSPGGI